MKDGIEQGQRHGSGSRRGAGDDAALQDRPSEDPAAMTRIGVVTEIDGQHVAVGPEDGLQVLRINNVTAIRARQQRRAASCLCAAAAICARRTREPALRPAADPAGLGRGACARACRPAHSMQACPADRACAVIPAVMPGGGAARA